MTQKIEQSQRQDRVATWSRHAESELSAYQSTAKVELQAQTPATKSCALTWKTPFVVRVYRMA